MQHSRRKIEEETGLSLGGEQLLFHGTYRECSLGDSRDKVKLCSSLTCNVCRILYESFRVDRAGTAPGRNFLRFGKGIYTTSISSK